MDEFQCTYSSLSANSLSPCFCQRLCEVLNEPISGVASGWGGNGRSTGWCCKRHQNVVFPPLPFTPIPSPPRSLRPSLLSHHLFSFFLYIPLFLFLSLLLTSLLLFLHLFFSFPVLCPSFSSLLSFPRVFPLSSLLFSHPHFSSLLSMLLCFFSVLSPLLPLCPSDQQT